MYYAVIGNNKRKVNNGSINPDNTVIIVFCDKKSAIDFSQSGNFKGNTKVKELKTRNTFKYCQIFENLKAYNDAIEKVNCIPLQTQWLIQNKGEFTTTSNDALVSVFPIPETHKYKINDQVWVIDMDGGEDIGSCRSELARHFNIESYQGKNHNRDWQTNLYRVVGICTAFNSVSIFYHLLSMNSNCQLVVSEGGLFMGTKEEFEHLLKYDDNDVVEFNRIKCTVKKEHIEKLYTVGIGGCVGVTNIICSEQYSFIPGKFMKSGKNRYLGVESTYDGGKLAREQGAYKFQAIKDYIENNVPFVIKSFLEPNKVD